jgi:hypothetical protein
MNEIVMNNLHFVSEESKMKKILAILLVIAMLLPMCFTVTAEGASDVEIKPFNISTSLKEGFDNIWPKIHFWTRVSEDYVTEDSIKISAMDVGGKTPKEVAENLKPVFDAYPDGMRYIRMMLNTLPIEYLTECRPMRLDIHFAKECRLGEVLTIGYEQRDNLSLFEIRNGEGAVACTAAIEWK